MSSRPTVHVDESRRPLIVITFTGVPTDEDFTAYLETQTRVVLRRERNMVLIDAMGVQSVLPSQRRQQAEWQLRHKEALRLYTIGTAFAIRSSVVRGFLTAILWVQPLPHPHHVAASRADAERWAIAQLLAAGLSVPSPVLK